MNRSTDVDDKETRIAEAEESVQKAMSKICPLYYDLLPVFGGRPLATPVFHSSTEDTLGTPIYMTHYKDIAQ